MTAIIEDTDIEFIKHLCTSNAHAFGMIYLDNQAYPFYRNEYNSSTRSNEITFNTTITDKIVGMKISDVKEAFVKSNFPVKQLVIAHLNNLEKNKEMSRRLNELEQIVKVMGGVSQNENATKPVLPVNDKIINISYKDTNHEISITLTENDAELITKVLDHIKTLKANKWQNTSK